jgi:hypothetical protein
MKSGSRDEPGTRLHAEQQFREGAIQVLVATEAAGEGINLQVCNILFNYDIPWNPNRLEQRMGRIHRYGQRKDCLIFNFVARNTIEGRVLQRLLEKLQEIRDALDDDAVFNVVGEVLPAAQIERVLRDYYAGRLGDTDLEDRLLRNVDETQFRAICQNALEGLASKKLNLDMLIERRARAQERRIVPETIARFLQEAAEYVPLTLRSVASVPHAFEPARTPTVLRRYERDADWKLPALADRYPRCSTDRDTAETEKLEWVTPGHPLFEAIRRHTYTQALDVLAQGATVYSLQHEHPARIDFYRARVVDGLGQVIHERLFAIEIADDGTIRLQEPGALGNFIPADVPPDTPAVTAAPEATTWLHENALVQFLEEMRRDRLTEVDRVSAHVELSLTELLQRADEEIGRVASDADQKLPGAEGRLVQAEARHAELLAGRDRRRADLERQRALTLQSVERLTSVLILPHPEREAPEVRQLKPNFETEATAVHLVCRPRPHNAPIGDWADVPRELPKRVGDWMEHLQSEGVRGADLVFACIGPALEIFSRYAKVETADGREVKLDEYLKKVWEVVGRSALSQVLGTAEARARNGAAAPLRRTRGSRRCSSGRCRARMAERSTTQTTTTRMTSRRSTKTKKARLAARRRVSCWSSTWCAALPNRSASSCQNGKAASSRRRRGSCACCRSPSGRSSSSATRARGR